MRPFRQKGKILLQTCLFAIISGFGLRGIIGYLKGGDRSKGELQEVLGLMLWFTHQWLGLFNYYLDFTFFYWCLFLLFVGFLLLCCIFVCSCIYFIFLKEILVSYDKIQFLLMEYKDYIQGHQLNALGIAYARQEWFS